MRAKAEGLMNLLGQGTSFNGTMRVKGSIRLDGTSEGHLQVTETLIVGKGGVLKGEVKTKDAVIGGRIVGKLFATDRVEFQAGANLEGDLVCKLLVMEEGALLDGSCKMSEGKPREPAHLAKDSPGQ